MLIVIVSARVLSGRAADLASAAQEMVASTRDDDGCESYGFFADLADPDRIVSIEHWRDRAAFDAHMAHSHTQDFIQRTASLVEGPPAMTIHEAAAVS